MTTIASLAVRAELDADKAAIRTILRAAFARDAEADLVDRLRTDGDLVLALVAASKSDEPVGYVGFPRLSLETGNQSLTAVGLAPLAVMPAQHRRGIGSMLVREGLRALAQRGERLLFVLGDPAYYGRFGFTAATAATYRAPYAGAHFMAMRLADGGPQSGHIQYPAAFAGLP
jgi:putative acetyltransferase